MKRLAALSATLSIVFSPTLAPGQPDRSRWSGAALAMGGPVYIDETCVSLKEARATPALKAWIKRQCPQGEASPDAICKDFAPFIRDVVANNENWRRKCAGK